jgi:hypothetical protein
MLKHHSVTATFQRWLYCFIGLTLMACSVRGQDYDPDWTRHFRVGLLVGLNIKADFKMNGPFNLANPGQAGIYDDGYVLPGQLQNGYTANWGYQNQSQNTYGSETLLMHRTSSFSASGESSGDGSGFPGFDMEYGGRIAYWRNARVGWDVGFGLLPINITAKSSLAGEVTRQVFTFNTGNSFLPEAPYNGNANSGPESSIRTNHTVSTETGTGTINSEQTLDVTLYTFRLGPSLYWDINSKIGLSVGIGPAVGFISGDLTFEDDIGVDGSESTKRSKGKISGTDIVYGGYVNAALMYHAVANGDFYLGIQYMPMGSAKIGNSSRQAQLRLEGQVYLSAGINWPF